MNQYSYNIDQVNLAKDSYQASILTYKTLKKSQKELKNIGKKVDSGEVDALRDKIEDLVEKSEDLSHALGHINEDYIDEDELDAELSLLNEDIVERKTTSLEPKLDLNDENLRASLEEELGTIAPPSSDMKPEQVKLFTFEISYLTNEMHVFFYIIYNHKDEANTIKYQ